MYVVCFKKSEDFKRRDIDEKAIDIIDKDISGCHIASFSRKVQVYTYLLKLLYRSDFQAWGNKGAISFNKTYIEVSSF